MKASFLLVATLALIGVSSSTNIEPRVDYGNVNLYVDLLLRRINSKLPDTIPLQDIDGPVKLTECFFIGLDNGIHRNGQATFVKQDDVMKFSSGFKFKAIGIECKWKYVLMHGKATGTSAEVKLDTGITWTFTTNQHPWLTEFVVSEMDDIKVDIKGLTFAFNWIAESITEAIINSYNDAIIYAIEHQVKDAIQNIMNSIVLP